MRKGFTARAIVLAIFLSLGVAVGFYCARYKYGVELEQHAVINANALLVALAHLDRGNINEARDMLSSAIDGDVLKMQEYENLSSESAHEQYRLDILRKIFDFKKKYPSTSTPETDQMRKQIDSYLRARTAGKKVE